MNEVNVYNKFLVTIYGVELSPEEVRAIEVKLAAYAQSLVDMVPGSETTCDLEGILEP